MVLLVLRLLLLLLLLLLLRLPKLSWRTSGVSRHALQRERHLSKLSLKTDLNIALRKVKCWMQNSSDLSSYFTKLCNSNIGGVVMALS